MVFGLCGSSWLGSSQHLPKKIFQIVAAPTVCDKGLDKRSIDQRALAIRLCLPLKTASLWLQRHCKAAALHQAGTTSCAGGEQKKGAIAARTGLQILFASSPRECASRCVNVVRRVTGSADSLYARLKAEGELALVF